MIKYLQYTWYDKLKLKINDIAMSDCYADADFEVHSDMKSHTGGVLYMEKGAIQKFQWDRRSIQKVIYNQNW